MTNTFRELFDEEEREEIYHALKARLTSMRSRRKQALRTETAGNQTTIDRLEDNIERLESMIATVLEESN